MPFKFNPVTGKLDLVNGPGAQGPEGPEGPTGATGPAGNNGQGVPTGGTTGQILAKIDGTDYNTEWIDDGGGSGAVDSVFGRTGDVVATTNDYTWAQVDKTTSDLADLNVKSHTSLTDKGTNTHAQIDTHIASTSNPHSVTAAQVNAVALTGDQTVAGIKTFSSIPVLPSSDPIGDNDAVRKIYVDGLLTTGRRFVTAVNATTDADLPASTYNNGASGVGATLTADANGAFPTIDGVTATLANYYLIKDQAAAEENGAYELTTLGDGSNPWVLTRLATYDQSAEIVGGTFFNILEGSIHIRQQWSLVNTGTVTVGTTELLYGLLSAAPNYTGSNGVQLTAFDFSVDLSDTNPSLEISDGGLRAKVDGTTVTRTSGGLTVGTITDSNISGAVSVSHGGTGLTALGTANQVLGVNSDASAIENKSIVGGSNVTVTHSAGQIEIASSLTGAADYLYTQATMLADPTTNFVYTNLPAAVTTASTAIRITANLTGAVQYRIVVNQLVAGFAGSKLRLRYSTNNSTFLDIGTANTGDLDVGTGTGVKVGAWENITSGAKQDVWLQIFGYNGDGIVDPAFRQMHIEFKYNSTIVDGSSTDTVYTEATIHSHPNSALIWTNMPAASTEFLGSTTGRVKKDLTGITHYRIVVNQSVAGFAGADINLQYSLNNSTFTAADAAAAGELDVGTGTGVKVGAWAALADAARQDVWLRLVGKQGDGIVDPAWRQVAIQFKGKVFSVEDGNVIVNATCNSGVAVGEAVRMVSGVAEKAQADTLANSKLIGIVESKLSSTVCNIRVAGVSSAIFSGLTENDDLFLSEATAGTISHTVPASGFVTRVGYAYSSTRMIVNKGQTTAL